MHEVISLSAWKDSSDSPVSDADALRRARLGHRAAIAWLYDHHAPRLFAVALRIVRSGTDAEDILHDVFVSLQDRAAQFDASRGSVLAWLVVMVRNLAIDRFRRRGRRREIIEQHWAEERLMPLPSVEDRLSDAGRCGRARRALHSLPKAQRETLELVFFEGLSYPEIAEVHGVPLGTVKSRAARAMNAVRGEIADEPLLPVADVG